MNAIIISLSILIPCLGVLLCYFIVKSSISHVYADSSNEENATINDETSQDAKNFTGAYSELREKLFKILENSQKWKVVSMYRGQQLHSVLLANYDIFKKIELETYWYDQETFACKNGEVRIKSNDRTHTVYDKKLARAVRDKVCTMSEEELSNLSKVID